MNSLCFFVSDLHGKMSRYSSLMEVIEKEIPELVCLGGDLLPHARMNSDQFAREYIPGKLRKLKKTMGSRYPLIVMIPGNDDPGEFVPVFKEYEAEGLWVYLHMKTIPFKEFTLTGYAMVPPTPFLNKDWEKYDISRYADPGCVEPNEGYRTVEPDHDIEYSTIQKDLRLLSENLDVSKAIFLFHSPPYQCFLDRAALDGLKFDHIPLDVHVGSIAIQRFIEDKQPLLTLHGHIHESARLTGHWYQHFQQTVSVNAAHDGPELSLIRFNPYHLSGVNRELLG
jgi:Icc-related predicted phosphoesterase